MIYMFDLKANKILNYMTLSSNDFTKLCLPQSDLIGATTAYGCNRISPVIESRTIAVDLAETSPTRADNSGECATFT